MSDLGESLDLAAYEIEKRDQQIESEREKSRQLKIAVDKATDLIKSLTRELAILKSRASQFESTLKETMRVRDLAVSALEKIEDSKDLIAASEAREALTKIKAVGE